MPYYMTKREKETSLLYNQSNDPTSISTYDPSLLLRLASFAQQYPDHCKRIGNGTQADFAEYEISKNRVSIRLLPPISDERKAAASERAKNLGLGRHKSASE